MKFKFQDIEVAGESIVSLISLLQSTQESESDKFQRILKPGARIPWSDLCDLLDAAVDKFGEEALGKVAKAALDTPRYRRRTKLARQLLTLQDALRFFLIPRFDPDFPNVRQFVDAGPGRIDIHAYLKDGYQPSRNYFIAMEGAFQAVTKMFGIQGVHTSENHSTRAHFSFRFSEPTGFAADIRSITSRKLLFILSFPNVLRSKEILDRQTMDLELELIKRRQVEEHLEKSEEALRRRIAHISDIIFEFDDQQQLIYISPNMTRMLGYSHEELVSNPAIILPIEHHEQVTSMLAQEDFHIASYQLNLINKAGERIWFELAISSFLVAGAPHQLVVARDISARRQADAEMLNVQKLETLGVLSGSIAHDFNNLLVPIFGHAELLIEGATAGSLAAESAHQILKASMKAADLTRRLLSYAGDRVEVHERVALSEEVNDLLKLTQTFVPAKVIFTHDIENAINIIGDIVQIRQVIMNLISNAAESIGDGVGEVRVSLTRQGARCRLTVEDTGCGMTEEQIGRIFTPFYTTKIAGRGLGLAAVQGIIKGHNGELTINSQPGVGTTVDVWLRLTDVTKHEALTREDIELTGSGHVLLLDDEEHVRKVAERILTKQGFDVVSIGDCDEAIEIFAKDSKLFNIVLLDVMMPKLNGFEVLALMREIDPSIPAVLITGFGPHFGKDKMLTANNTRILQKPYSINELAHVVHSLARKNPKTVNKSLQHEDDETINNER